MSANECDEVYPNIFVGNRFSSQNPEYLQKMGIRYNLNASGREYDNSYKVDAQPECYLNLDIIDLAECNISQYFPVACDFIAAALQNNGRILLHCVASMSRSITLAMAYLIKHERMTTKDALIHVQTKRLCIRPNDGFLSQLLCFEATVKNAV